MIGKNIRMMIAAATIALAASPVAATRADDLNWDAQYTMPELGIQFSYPSDWTLTEVKGGVTISADEADVARSSMTTPKRSPLAT
jgi:hypothetical protein